MNTENFFEIYQNLPEILEEKKKTASSRSSLLKFIENNPDKIIDSDREIKNLINQLNKLNMQISDIQIVLKFLQSLKKENSGCFFVSKDKNYVKSSRNLLNYDCERCGNKHPIIVSPANGESEQRYVICKNRLYKII